jgi:hypothetical protein
MPHNFYSLMVLEPTRVGFLVTKYLIGGHLIPLLLYEMTRKVKLTAA